jgi:hypothetical protein
MIPSLAFVFALRPSPFAALHLKVEVKLVMHAWLPGPHTQCLLGCNSCDHRLPCLLQPGAAPTPPSVGAAVAAAATFATATQALAAEAEAAVAVAAAAAAAAGDGGFLPDAAAQEAAAPPPRRKAPKIYYATRTHSQIAQVGARAGPARRCGGPYEAFAGCWPAAAGGATSRPGLRCSALPTAASCVCSPHP